jgi:hypothetical protein
MLAFGPAAQIEKGAGEREKFELVKINLFSQVSNNINY